MMDLGQVNRWRDLASKIAAIFLRKERKINDAVYEEKGRDIYDLLSYMNKKIVPDIDYLIAKGVNTKDPQKTVSYAQLTKGKKIEKFLDPNSSTSDF